MSDLAAIEAQIVQLETRAVKLRAYIELASEYEVHSPSPEPQNDAPPKNKITPDSPFYGKSLARAAIIALELAGEPLDPAEIANQLRKAGWDFVSGNPNTTITFALASTRNQTSELVKISGGKWSLTKWRDPSVAKSVAGLNAARERGVRLGPPPKMTPELKAAANEMLDRKVRTAEIAANLGVSEITIKRYKAAYRKMQAGGVPKDFFANALKKSLSETES